MKRSFNIAARGILGAMVVALLTICSLLLLFYLAPYASFSRWHTAVTLLGFFASMGVMLWSILAQGPQKRSS